MKFKIGDKVRIKNDLVRGKIYDDLIFFAEMEKYKGKIFTINEEIDIDNYELEDNEYVYNSLMLEKCNPILDEKEKKYLSNIIYPFRKRVKNFCKHKNDLGWYICINLNDIYGDEEFIYLPYFKENMYKNMEEEVNYSLDELEL